MNTQPNRPVLHGSADAGEDKKLTEFLTGLLAALLAPSHDPRPRCPRCGAGHINSAGFRTRPIGRLPMFECQTCRRYFSRTAGTPLGEKHLKRLDLFVSLQSQPISCLEAGKQMGSLPDDIGERVKVWRAWLLQLDPSGQWERRIRLGGRPTELDPAPLTFDEVGAREDRALTARLTREFDDINSLSQQPPASPIVAVATRASTNLRTARFRASCACTAGADSPGAVARRSSIRR